MPQTDTRAKLQGLVDQFVATIGYSQAPDYHPLVVSLPYCPYDDLEGRLSYPDPNEPGCYVFTSGNGTPLYVGKASRYLGNRIWSHIGRRPKSGETEAYPDAEKFVKDNQPDIAVWAIAVPDAHWWLAPALEGFLTEKLRPTIPRP